MLDFEGRQIPNQLSEIVDPKNTLLLVWDMQNDQAGGSFNKEALIRNAPPLIAAAARANIATVYTRQTPFLWKEEAVTWIRRAMIDQKVDHPSKLKARRIRGSFGWQIMEPFKPTDNDFFIDKRRPTMFIGNEFETIMQNRGATTVVMIGCTTDGGWKRLCATDTIVAISWLSCAIASVLTLKTAITPRSNVWSVMRMSWKRKS